MYGSNELIRALSIDELDMVTGGDGTKLPPAAVEILAIVGAAVNDTGSSAKMKAAADQIHPKPSANPAAVGELVVK